MDDQTQIVNDLHTAIDAVAAKVAQLKADAAKFTEDHAKKLQEALAKLQAVLQ